MNHQNNIDRIITVHDALNQLVEKVVYVGGVTLPLYVGHQAGEGRPTEDVDIIVEVFTYAELTKIEEQLKSFGFQHDKESNFIYRYRYNEVKVDLMPLDQNVLGFSNKWYKEGFENAISYTIDEKHIINILPAAYFIAAKLEAFQNRGNDPRQSTDFEDIVYVLENRNTIWDELNETEGELREYLIDQFKGLENRNDYEELIDAHVELGSPPATEMIIDGLSKFTK